MFSLTTAIRTINNYYRICAHLKRLALTTTDLIKLHDASQQFGVVSAYRSDLSRNENKRRHTELVQLLNVSGYSWEGAQGTWEVGDGYALENSFIIYDIPLNILIEIADIYDQEAVIFKGAEEPVGLFDLEKRVVNYLTDMQVETDVPRPRIKEELGIEHVPSTRFRDVEVTYDFDWEEAVPF